MIVILLIMLLISYTVHYIALEEERIFQAKSTIAYYEKELQRRLHERSLRTYAFCLGKTYLTKADTDGRAPITYSITELFPTEDLQLVYKDDSVFIARYNAKTALYDYFCTLKYVNGSYELLS